MKKKYLYSLTKIDTTEISIFDFDRNLIIISINYDEIIFIKKKYTIYGHVYANGLYRISIF